jgi:hypothetical protein
MSDIHADDKRTRFGRAIRGDTRQQLSTDLDCREPVRCARLHAGKASPIFRTVSKSIAPPGIGKRDFAGRTVPLWLGIGTNMRPKDYVAAIVPESRSPFKISHDRSVDRATKTVYLVGKKMRNEVTLPSLGDVPAIPRALDPDNSAIRLLRGSLPQIKKIKRKKWKWLSWGCSRHPVPPGRTTQTSSHFATVPRIISHFLSGKYI